MSSELVKAIEAAKNVLAKLTAQLEGSRKSLGTLHKKFGFSSVDDLITELRAPASPTRKGRKGSRAKAAPVEGDTKKKGKRTRITPEIKNSVKAAVKAGKTGAVIAK